MTNIPQCDGLDISCSESSVSEGMNPPSKSSTTLPGETSWFSQCDASSLEEPPHPKSIPVHIGYRPVQEDYQQGSQSYGGSHSNNIYGRRDNRLIEGLSLPIFSVYNMRSIWSKLDSLSHA